MKLTITIVIDTNADNPMILDSTCVGTEQETLWAHQTVRVIGDSLQPVVAAITGKPIEFEREGRLDGMVN